MSDKPWVKVILGRDGMGELATEADFDAWAEFVTRRLGEDFQELDLKIELRGKRDVQNTDVRGEGAEVQDVERAVFSDLWNEFCGSPELWPAASSSGADQASG